MKRRIEFRIPADYAGLAIGEFLARRFPYHGRAQWEERIAARRVRVNGVAADTSLALREGDVVEHLSDDVPEPPADLNAAILYRDDDIIVVNKPANLTVHPGGRYFHHTLWAVLKERHGMADPAFVNRLDRETSGLVVVACNDKAAMKCRRQFADRRVAKRYLALVEGPFPRECRAEGLLVEDVSFGRHKRRLFKPVAACAEGEQGDPASTMFRLARLAGPISEVEARPETGRLHQIRATLCWMGYPVVGDKLYGVDPTIFLRFCTDTMTEGDRLRMRMGRQALHAAGLRFRHPRTGKWLEFDLPLPDDMTGLVAGLGADSAMDGQRAGQ
jgi:23S rRNA pseudouridine955/2504/2580 synthase/23S rRNA pseudouridine1911/1915/1917 synthase